jgi:PAS domain S-box-containing protein
MILRFKNGVFAQCMVGVIAVAVALLIRASLARYGTLPHYQTFYPFILLVALLSGIWAGLMTTGLSALAVLYWLPPSSAASHKISLVIFCTTGICVSIVAELYHRQRKRLAERTSQLEAANVQLQADIAGRQRAEEALRESESRFRALFQHSPDAVFMAIPDGGILAANPAACAVFRMSEAEICRIGREGLVDRDDPRYVAALKERQRTGRVVKTEISFFRRGGERFPAEVDSVILPGVPPQAFVILRDITERKRAEEALLQSEKLASLGRMAATIAHEINNPLEAVMNLLFLARGSNDLCESTRHLLEAADAELRRIAHITRQSLGFYRESSAPARTSVSTVLDSVLDLLKNRIKATHAVIDKQWNGDVQVTAVAGELRQVFSNLISNSLDAIDEGGVIKLRVSAGNQRVRITVADNGKGIPPSVRQHIFQPFFTTKDKFGTGLGLWVSQQIVEKHGGSIRVRSNTNGVRRGTTFSLVLPVEPTPAAQTQSRVA